MQKGIKNPNYKHGGNKTKLHMVWLSIKQRCFNKNTSQYHNYGGRGITLCDEWLVFSAFQKWAIESGYEQGLSIDRIDVNKAYSPDNCRWATPKEQANNTRRTRLYEIEGEVLSMKQWAERYDVPYSRVKKRIWSGMSILEAISKPKVMSRLGLKNKSSNKKA